MVKNKIRKSLFEQGQSLSDEYKAKSDLIIQTSVLKEIDFGTKKNILLYFPFRNEVFVNLILKELKQQSKNIYMPRVIDKETIKFNLMEDSDILIENKFGIPEQDNNSYLTPSLFDVMFIPLVGVDSGGHRLGYGSGYFDRVLGSFKTVNQRPLIVGLAYDYQICNEKFGKEHDLKYDIVISEKRVLSYS